MDWYIVQTKPSGHKLAQKHLHLQGLLATFIKEKKFINNLKPCFPLLRHRIENHSMDEYKLN